MVIKLNQTVNLMLLLAIRSNGVSNDVFDESLAVFHYHLDGTAGGRLIANRRLEYSSQVFILELTNVEMSSEGNYTVCMYSKI